MAHRSQKISRFQSLLVIATVGLGGFFPTFASASEGGDLKTLLGPTGSIRSAYWSKDKSYLDRSHYGVGSAWLNLRPAEVAGFRGYADGYLQFENVGRTDDSQGDLRELFIERSVGDFDFRAGRQIIVWGRADKTNPTDSLSVRDFRRLFTDDEDQRTGLGSLQATYNVGDYRVKGVWIAEWRSPGLPLPVPAAGISFVDRPPSASARQFALKLDHSGASGWDWSASYFRGFTKTPDLIVVPKVGGIDIGLRYSEVDVFGADFATTIGALGLRGEAAYTRTEDDSATDVLAQNSFLFSVLGVEYSPIENLNFNLQYLNRWVSRFQDPTLIANATNRLLATQAAINTQQLVAMNHGVTLRPSYKVLNDTLELEIAWVRWFTTRDQLVRPKLTYALNDHWRMIAGAEIYSGPSLSFFGRLQPTSAGFLEVRLLF